MDRRATLAKLFGKKEKGNEVQVRSTVVSGLTPYVGVWDFEKAAHLLRRTTYGPTYAKIKAVLTAGVESTVDQLLAPEPLPDPPLNFNYTNDPNVPIGATWINAPFSATDNFIGYRGESLAAWTLELMANQGISIREKMVLFWHNHFVTANNEDTRYIYRYSNLLRTYATGNFKTLTKEITIDPAMLRYLNGNQNIKAAPNENYARELLELFTVGKGPVAGPGDYTTFTEQDVIAMAKVLTGWRDIGYLDNTGNVPVQSIFIAPQHDTSDKQLSARFNNAIISNNGAEEYQDLIDVIFENEAAAKHICRKLYRWFVFYEISAEIEQTIINPMAACLLENDFEIKPVLSLLLKSAHFYDVLNIGCMIKNPIDFTLSAFKQFEIAQPTDLEERYTLWVQIFGVTNLQQMQYYTPPSVAGWKAYYQEPGYAHIWINSVTLPYRLLVTNVLSFIGFEVGNTRIIIDVFDFVSKIDDPTNPNAVVIEFAKILFPQALAINQIVFLKNILIPGLPDFEWTVEYGAYLADPDNEMLANPVRIKLQALVRTMLSMPEFHLS